MCGRFSLKAAPDDLQRQFGVAPPLPYRPRFNIAPMQEVLAIVCEQDGAPEARLLRWGLVPFWADDPAIGNRMINARAETIAEKPAYRNAFARRRCVVLADGFYEWLRRPGGKQPMWIHSPSGGPFAFAAVWERWGGGLHPLDTCSILTTSASEFMRPIHDRMPVILGERERGSWLRADSPRDELVALLAEYRAPELAAYAVSTLVNSPANDVEACLAPLAEADAD